jgi:arginase family enzyme
MTRPVLTRFAGRAGDHNDHAMTGSAYLAAALATRLGTEPAVVGHPEPALSTGWREELDTATPQLRQMAERYTAILRAGQTPVTALTRCAVALATLPAVASHHPDAVVIWFDAHADINTPATTTTGYLGGLALSGPLGLWDTGLGAGLTDAILVGARDIDPPEHDLITAGAVTLVPVGATLAEDLRRAVAGRPVYVHIDCDVLEPGLAATDYRVPDGLTLDDLHAAATVLAESEITGLEVAEFEAADDPAWTATAAARLIQALEPLLAKVSGGR